jgi:hypothetical protein
MGLSGSALTGRTRLWVQYSGFEAESSSIDAFRQKDVVSLMGRNFSLTKQVACSTGMASLISEEPDVEMKDVGEVGSENMETKAKIIAALDEIQFTDKRSAKLDLDDFLRLLSTFNRHGFHFA